MKNELPPLWRTQLTGIILLFSIGLALFPLGLSFMLIPVLDSDEYGTTFHDQVEVSLTFSNPDVNVSVGECMTIEVNLWLYNRYNNSQVTLRVLNSTDILSNLTYSIGTEVYLHIDATIHLDTIQNYTVQFHREAQDVTFGCNIFAYSYHICVYRAANSPMFHWLVGGVLIVFGIVLAVYFVNRNKECYSGF